MTIEHTELTRRVELRVREHAPTPVLERVDTVHSRLLELESSGVIDDLRTETWAGRQSRTAGIVGDTPAAVVDAYRAWASDVGCSLEPAFGRREATSMISAASCTEYVVPVVTVAVYDGDRLECVAPCTDGEETVTVEDCLDALAAEADDLLGAALGRETLDDVHTLERPTSPA